MAPLDPTLLSSNIALFMDISHRVIILHIGSESGFLEGGDLVYTKEGKNSDYHDDMNHTIYIEWLHKILPKLNPNSILCIDNARKVQFTSLKNSLQLNIT